MGPDLEQALKNEKAGSPKIHAIADFLQQEDLRHKIAYGDRSQRKMYKLRLALLTQHVCLG